MKTIKIPKTTGKKLIYNSKTFGWIDSDFKNEGLDKAETSRPEQQIRTFKTTDAQTLAQIFTDPEKMYVTQEQISYCVEKGLLDKKEYNLFLIKKSDGTFWAVYCHWLSGYGYWRVGANSLTDPYPWSTAPQVFVRDDSLNLEPEELPIETLTLPKSKLSDNLQLLLELWILRILKDPEKYTVEQAVEEIKEAIEN